MTARAKGTRRQRIVATDLDGWDDLDDALEHPSGLPPFALAMARADLDEAVARAACSSRPASPPTQSSSPKAAAQQEAVRILSEIAETRPQIRAAMVDKYGVEF